MRAAIFTAGTVWSYSIRVGPTTPIQPAAPRPEGTRRSLRVLLVEDSIVRSTTLQSLLHHLRDHDVRGHRLASFPASMGGIHGHQRRRIVW